MSRIGLQVLLVGLVLVACDRRGAHQDAGPREVGAREGKAVLPLGLRDVHSTEVPLEGCWMWDWLPGFDLIVLSVRRLDEATFELDFLRSMCVGGSEHRTTARWTGVGLELERTDSTALDAKMLYPIRFQGEDYLVPDCTAGLHAAPRPFVPSGADENFAFERVEVGQASGCREAAYAARGRER